MQAEGYRERLRGMTDAQLKKEWEEPQGGDYWQEGMLRREAEHEMAMRWRRMARLDDGSYYMDKLMAMPGEFRDAYARKEWARAKRIYDDICRLAVFLEIPFEKRMEIFGHEEDDGTVIQGLVPRKDVARVMRECIIKNRLGFECMVYRVPGEAGYHGAQAMEGARRMAAADNPAYHCTDARETVRREAAGQ